MTCNEAVAALVASVESGTELTAGHRDHLRTCERCSPLLDSAKQFEASLSDPVTAPPDVDDAVLHDEVLRAHRRSLVWRFGAFVGIVLALVAQMAWRSRYGPGVSMVEFVVVTSLFLFFVLVPGLLLLIITASAAKRQGRLLYRRLDSRRWWLGVCAGIEEAVGVDRNLLRVGFVLLLLLKGLGLPVYIVLALATPVHPADREYLWRFQARRLLTWIRSL